MSPRLPVPGSDAGRWGTILNDFLEVAHNTDGTLVQGAEFAAKYDKPAGGIPRSDLTAEVQSALDGSSAFSTYQLKIAYSGLNPQYVGEATRGTATTDSSWTILKITYDGSNNPTVLQTADGAWDSRGALSYS